MPRAQCYYEILGIEETATTDDVKKAYKAQALIWHPDKNQSNPDEAHKRFQTILKAYETLSDSRERDWYDRHKDQILSENDTGQETEKYINLFQFFSSSCYANFDDSEDGFYTVYREVFQTLAKEEEQARDLVLKLSKSKNNKANQKLQATDEYPTFGDSCSTYDDVVGKFYAFWSGFCTIVTFDHLDKYNTTEAENRRILRAMEKENSKIKDAARKERNNNVRKLVEFVRKRDKRVKAHKLVVEQQNQLNREKTAEKQRQQREKMRLQEQSTVYKPTAWEDMNNLEEQLRQLENELDSQEGTRKKKSGKNTSLLNQDQNMDTDLNDCHEEEEAVDEESEEDEDELGFFCPACNKDFQSIKAFENHEASKKHKQNVAKLKKLLKDDEERING